MQAINSILNHQQQQSQMTLQDLGQHQQQQQQQMASQPSHFDPAASSHDDFLEQMLSALPSSSWPDLAGAGNPKSLPWELSNPVGPDDSDGVYTGFEDPSAFLASKLRQHQITGSGGGGGGAGAAKAALMQQLLMSRGLSGGLRSPTGASGAGDSGLLSLPLSGDSFDRSNDGGGDVSSFKSPVSHFTTSMLRAYEPKITQITSDYGGNYREEMLPFKLCTTASPDLCRTQPSISSPSREGRFRRRTTAARWPRAKGRPPARPVLRRERIAERMKALQELVPNANKTDKASMLDEIIDYVKFLQLQVKVLSMSRLGGAAAVAPLVADISSEGGGDCIQTNGGAGGRSGSGAQTASPSSDSMTVTEHQVAKLMEEDMGSAMQYLQGKGLCLMPISLATAISTATCHPRTAASHHQLRHANGEGGPASPSMSVLTVQSATMGNGVNETSVKDAASVSKP
ncbi:hypothetical protein RJ640_012594 [Escallonia rubra]|uniref:BHLH domain-containing protein n=1 Tax=Escallonia rubra TaxID=112253 RepID=A0AA88UBT6_9ASTE|nr:hypothetical protein RJ640_012594 [Escallonia rubra]